MVKVVAGLIKNENGLILICQRPQNKARPLLWEFVGGKIEKGETGEQALIRECREELDIDLSVGDIYMQVTHEYPEITVQLTLYNAVIIGGKPKRLEHNDIRWVSVHELVNYDFCPADKPIIQKLLENK